MKYTPVIWEVETDAGSKIGYMELMAQPGDPAQYHPTVYPSNRGGPASNTYEEATRWLLENADEVLTDAELVQRPNALTDPTQL